ncbi:MAG: BatA and WFA domain-containing protein [Phycisphaerae bacterium]|nr:BatA and WFA domain-containing protein [Phycisphaerae bacterium]
MTWLTPLAGILLAALTIPPLVALYFLKLRRLPRPIGSTLLWKKSLEDLRANAPFQRLRMNILLILQLLVLGLLAFALAQPQVDTGLRRGGRTVLLIDNSASMNAIDVSEDRTKPTSRLELAKTDAIARVEKLFGGSGLFSGSAGEVMVIAFADRAEVRCPFSDSRTQVIDAIRGIEATDGRTKIGEALQLARAYTMSVDPDKVDPTAVEQAALVVFSDGRIEDLDAQAKKTGEEILYNRVGSMSADNVGVIAIAAERSVDDPDRIQAFAAIANGNAAEVQCDVQLSVDGRPRAITPEPVVIPAANSSAAVDVAPELRMGDSRVTPGREQVVFLPFAQPRDAIISVRQLREDDLAVDDTASLVVPPARRLRVAHVSDSAEAFGLKTVLGGMRLESYAAFSVAEFEKLIADGDTERFDVIVLESYTPSEGVVLPPGRYLSWSGSPVPEFKPYAEHKGVYFRAARQEHPIFRSVNLVDLWVGRADAISPPAEVEVLMEGTDGGLMFALDRGGLRILHVAFAPLESLWPMQRSFVNFVPNALEWLGSAGEALALAGLQPGETASIRLPSTATNVTLQFPDGRTEDVTLASPGQFNYGPIRRVGIYTISWSEPNHAERQERRFAANLLNAREGLITPAVTLALASGGVEGTSVGANTRSAVWPILLAVAIALLLLEWWVYQRRTA